MRSLWDFEISLSFARWYCECWRESTFDFDQFSMSNFSKSCCCFFIKMSDMCYADSVVELNPPRVWGKTFNSMGFLICDFWHLPSRKRVNNVWLSFMRTRTYRSSAAAVLNKSDSSELLSPAGNVCHPASSLWWRPWIKRCHSSNDSGQHQRNRKLKYFLVIFFSPHKRFQTTCESLLLLLFFLWLGALWLHRSTAHHNHLQPRAHFLSQ